MNTKENTDIEDVPSDIDNAIQKIIDEQIPEGEKINSEDLIALMVGTLEDQAGNSELVHYIANNSDKTFNKESLKVIAGSLGNPHFTKEYEMSIEQEASKAETKNTPPSQDEAKNKPSRKQSDNSPKVNNEEMSEQQKEVFENFKMAWIRKYKEKFPHLSDAELNELADEVVKAAMAQNSADYRENTKQQKNSPQSQSKQNQPYTNNQPSGNREQNLATMLAGVASNLVDITKSLINAAISAPKGMMDFVKDIPQKGKEKVANNISDQMSDAMGEKRKSDPTVQEMMEEEKPALTKAEQRKEQSYATRILRDSIKNLHHQEREANDTLNQIQSMKSSGSWDKKSQSERRAQLLSKLKVNMENINKLKNNIKREAENESVSKESRLDAIKMSGKTKDTIDRAKSSLGNSPDEKDLKTMAEKISNALSKIADFIKGLFGKKHRADKVGHSVTDNKQEIAQANDSPTKNDSKEALQGSDNQDPAYTP